MNEKIVLSISLALLISFSSLLFFVYSFPDSTQYREHKFYSQNFNPNINKIFLLGSSHVGELNATLINEVLEKNKQNYTVYNLAYYGDTPSERIKTINDILATKPKLIVYGVSYRDFQSQNNNQILPNVHDYFTKIFLKNQITDLDISDPKLITETAIHDLTNYHNFKGPKDVNFNNNTPFFPYLPSDMKILSYQELQQESSTSDAPSVYIEPPSKSQETLALATIINKCKENNVKIIIFTTPHHRIYLNDVPQSQKLSFNSTIEYIKKTFDTTVYDLTNKYEDLLIWKDINHVAYNKNSTIYSNDVAEIISREVSP